MVAHNVLPRFILRFARVAMWSDATGEPADERKEAYPFRLGRSLAPSLG
jgi:hypothetical protein